jgi:hypothetical protein
MTGVRMASALLLVLGILLSLSGSDATGTVTAGTIISCPG